METKEIKINVPDGYEIDKENSTFECIKFKPIVKRWRDDEYAEINGFFIHSGDSEVKKAKKTRNVCNCKCIFATEKQAKSALAMAQISQIVANDKRFGGIVTELEKGDQLAKRFYTIKRGRASNANDSKLIFYFEEVNAYEDHHFLTFHTKEQAILFIKENEDLVKDYLMID